MDTVGPSARRPPTHRPVANESSVWRPAEWRPCHELTPAEVPRTLARVLTEQITSRQNPLIKRAQRVRDGDEPAHLFIEGPRLVGEALESSIHLEAIIYTSDFAENDRGESLLERVARTHVRGALVPEAVMRAVCDTETPQGVVALGSRPRFELDDVFGGEFPMVVALDGLQVPGNVGTIVRAAEAAGASGVVTTPGTAEVYGPKALRASMGSAFRLPIVRRIPLDLVADAVGRLDGRVAGATASGKTDYSAFDWRRPAMLVIGSEGGGLSTDAMAVVTDTVSIPMVAPVESLNAGLAAAVILFEAARQRAGQRRS